MFGENKVIGIYEISVERDDGSRIYYIGKSFNIEGRRKKHLRDLAANNHHNQRLQNAFNKYGLSEEWFAVVEVLEDATD